MKRVAVVGGGIFGTTAAIHIAKAGHDVHLFEERPQLLSCASGINQFRVHRGYHYPRSAETARAAHVGEQSFREAYAPAVIGEGRNLYAVAREGSKVSPEAFEAFCKTHNLHLRAVDHEGLVNPDTIALLAEVEETWYDPHMLRALVTEELDRARAKVHLATHATKESLDSFDQIILATYARTNQLQEAHGEKTQSYQFEVCEKPVVRLPKSYGLTGIVVIDGPFTCLDPYGRTGLYVLGNVVHAIHATNVGIHPEVPSHLEPLLNRGVIEHPPHTAFKKFIEHGKQYLPILEQAEHVGSLFTIRTVLPHLDATDARPTIVSRVSDRMIRIFSGKISNCVDAAREALQLITESPGAVPSAGVPAHQTAR